MPSHLLSSSLTSWACLATMFCSSSMRSSFTCRISRTLWSLASAFSFSLHMPGRKAEVKIEIPKAIKVLRKSIWSYRRRKSGTWISYKISSPGRGDWKPSGKKPISAHGFYNVPVTVLGPTKNSVTSRSYPMGHNRNCPLLHCHKQFCFPLTTAASNRTRHHVYSSDYQCLLTWSLFTKLIIHVY